MFGRWFERWCNQQHLIVIWEPTGNESMGLRHRKILAQTSWLLQVQVQISSREKSQFRTSKNFLAIVHFGVILLLGGYRNFPMWTNVDRIYELAITMWYENLHIALDNHFITYSIENKCESGQWCSLLPLRRVFLAMWKLWNFVNNIRWCICISCYFIPKLVSYKIKKEFILI